MVAFPIETPALFRILAILEKETGVLTVSAIFFIMSLIAKSLVILFRANTSPRYIV